MPEIQINNETLTYNNIYYVEEINGDDSNDGSESSPLATVTEAYKQCSDGDAIYLIGNENANYNDYSDSIEKDIDFIGDGLNSVMGFESNDSIFKNSTENVSFYKIKIVCQRPFEDCLISVYFYNCILKFNYGIGSSGDAVNFNIYNSIFDATSATYGGLRNEGYIENSIVCGSLTGNSYGDFTIYKSYLNDNFYDTEVTMSNPNTDTFSYTVNSDYTIDGLDTSKLGTGTNPNGTQANIGLYGGPYGWGKWIELYHLFNDNGNIKTYKNGWNTICQKGNETEADFLDNGIENIDTTTLSDLNSSNPQLLTWTDDLENTRQTKLNVIPNDQLIIPNSDIDLSDVSNIDDITLNADLSGNGDIKIVASKDKGDTWQNISTSKDIILSQTEISENGITPEEFNNITSENWNEYIGDSNILRFAYYLDIDSETDIAETDLLEMQVDLQGDWSNAIHMTDYDYEYTDNNTITVDLLTDGSYKINYQK